MKEFRLPFDKKEKLKSAHNTLFIIGLVITLLLWLSFLGELLSGSFNLIVLLLAIGSLYATKAEYSGSKNDNKQK